MTCIGINIQPIREKFTSQKFMKVIFFPDKILLKILFDTREKIKFFGNKIFLKYSFEKVVAENEIN